MKRKLTLISFIVLITLFMIINVNNVVFAAFQVETDKDQYFLGETITIIVTGATPNGKVMLQLNDPNNNPVWTWEENANATGALTVQLTIPSDWPTGTYTLYGKDVSTDNTDTKTFNVLSPPAVTTVTLTANATNIYVNDYVRFTATVLDQYNNPMPNVVVSLYINDTFYGNSTTNANGEAIFDVQFTQVGIYQVYAKADTVTSNIVTITVSLPPPVVTTINLVANVTEIFVGEYIRFAATVYDQYGNVMPNVLVGLYINDSLVKSKYTDSNGKAIFDIKFNNTGHFNVYAMADTVKSNIITVNVKALPTVTTVTLTANATSIIVGSAVKFTATVYDQYGNPMPNIAVSLYINNTLNDTKITDSNGKAEFIVTFNQIGKYEVYAMADTVKSNIITISVSPVPPVVTTVTLTANATDIFTGEAVKFIATVYDQYGNTMAGISVGLYINDTLYTSNITDVNGKATFTVVFNQVGKFDVYAMADTVKSNVIRITVSLRPPVVTTIVLTANVTSIQVGGAVKFIATVYDQYGNVMAGVNVDLYINDTLMVTNVTAIDGRATFTITFNQVGRFLVYAMADTVKSNIITVNVLPIPPVVTRVILTANTTNIIVGNAVMFTATVYDQYGNTMAGIVVSFYINDLFYASRPTDVNGRAVLIVKFNDTGQFRVRAKADNVYSNYVFISVSPIPPIISRVELTSNLLEVEVDGEVVFTATVYDQQNNPVANVLVKLYVNGTLYDSKATGANGVAVFTVTFDEVGIYQVYAMADTVSSNVITIKVKPKIVVSRVSLTVDRTEITTGESATFTATVYDQYGRRMSNVLVKLYVNDKLVDSKYSDINGEAKFTVTFTKEGTYDVYAMADTVKSNVITITVKAPPPPPQVAVISLEVDRTEITAGESATFTATVLDQYGKPMSGVSVGLYINDKLYLTGSTDANGKVRFTITFTKAGSYDVYAMADTVKSNVITITVKAKPIPPVIPWWLIIVAILAIGIAIAWIITRRRT